MEQRGEERPEGLLGKEMPGVIMENGDRNGAHTNHDRDQRPNGTNGAAYVTEMMQEKGKGRAEPQQNMTPVSPTLANGVNGSFAQGAPKHVAPTEDVISPDMMERIRQLPPEIEEITTGYLPLSGLLGRLAQQSHNTLTDRILYMTDMPVPTSAMNGNASHITTSDDNSADNINKKLQLLNFAQDTHANWVKALVITEWSRKSKEVSKLIDIKAHLDKQKFFYQMAVHEMTEVKRSLAQARVPNPDLKTAVEVLSTGKAPWMPDVGRTL